MQEHKRIHGMNAKLRRVFEASECRTQVELASFLGIRQSSVSDAKRRQVIPAEWLVTLLRQKNVNPDWVLSGKEPRFLLPTDDMENNVAPARQIDGGYTLADFSTQELAEELVRRFSKFSKD